MSNNDGLKPLDEILNPDVRNSCFVRIDRDTGEQTQITIVDHYREIEHYHLDGCVPEDIATQYDVARNIYVYAWFQYRFFNVAEAQVLVVLELAMRKRIGEDELKRYISKRKKEYREQTGKKLSLSQGMKTLMEYCRDHDLVCNGGFTRWEQHGTQQAYIKKTNERTQWAIAEMERTGKKEIELPAIEVEELSPDLSYNHVQHLVDYTNKSRNNYAHGSTMLHNQVIGQFEMVSEFINQIFSK
jgi:hypothetical protein